MIIDGFTLFGSWPGLSLEHPIESVVRGLERNKIDRACLLSAKGIFFDAAVGNAATYGACQEDPRLISIGVADPRVNGVEQVEWCQAQGFRLMALFPVSQGWSFENYAAQLVLQRIAELRMPVLIEANREGDASAILHAAGNLDVPIILLDVSLPTLSEAMAVVHKRPNTYLATRLLCGGDTIEYLVSLIGADRLIFASRFPVSCFSSAFLTAKFAHITDDQRNAIIGGNLARLLA